MSSSNALNQHWEKLVFLVALAFLGLCIWLALGFFANVKDSNGQDPALQIRKVQESLNEAMGRQTVPVEPAPVTVVEEFTQALKAGSSSAEIRLWSFYDYKGYQAVSKPRPAAQEYRLPELTLSAEIDAAATIQIRWLRNGAVLPEHPHEGLIGEPAQFTLTLSRYELAAGEEAAVEVWKGQKWVLADPVVEKIGESNQPDVPAVQPGHTYRYRLTSTMNDDLLLAPGAKRTQDSAEVTVTAPDRFRVESMTGNIKGSNKDFMIGVLGGAAIKVTVKLNTLAGGKCFNLPADNELGMKDLPFRGDKEHPPQGFKPVKFYDLQRSFFGLHYRRTEIADQTAPPPNPGTGETPPESGGPDTQTEEEKAADEKKTEEEKKAEEEGAPK